MTRLYLGAVTKSDFERGHTPWALLPKAHRNLSKGEFVAVDNDDRTIEYQPGMTMYGQCAEDARMGAGVMVMIPSSQSIYVISTIRLGFHP